jgi:hypothetical protein
LVLCVALILAVATAQFQRRLRRQRCAFSLGRQL